MSSKIKQTGQVYTPPFLVEQILDLLGYSGSGILGKHIIDNSCGDGAFLVDVVNRYIEAALSVGKSKREIVLELEDYIHGIELDSSAAKICRERLDDVAHSHDIHLVSWDVETADALTHTRHIGKMDYVVGNPPYVRVHNIHIDSDALNGIYTFTRGGMTDLYLAFYELGLYMLNDTGVLGYVTPSSFCNSKAGSVMREYIRSTRCLRAIVDLMHYQPFGATTYAAIVVLTKEINKAVDYYTYGVSPVYVSTLEYGDFCVDDDTFVFQTGTLTQDILAARHFAKFCQVKNGFATLCDACFCADEFPFESHVIPVMKASTGKMSKCLFPYTESGRLIPFENLSPEVQEYLTERKERLLSRDIEKNGVWYGYGRAQGIKDVYSSKYAINSLIRTSDDIKLTKCSQGVGVYGGLYILTELSEDVLLSMLRNHAFMDFVKALGKYKSGGYYTYGSGDLQRYLNFMVSKTRS